MKSAKNILVLFVFSTTLFGCKKDAVRANADLEGNWCTTYYGPYSGVVVTINKSGPSIYSSRPCCGAGSEQYYTGNAKLNNDELKIGRKNLHVDAYPAYDNEGSYKMTLGGINLYAVMIPISPAASVSGTNVNFTWGYPSNGDAGLHETKVLDYKLSSSSTWTSINIDISDIHPSYLLTGLLSATSYDWRMKSVCGNHDSYYTATQTFITQ